MELQAFQKPELLDSSGNIIQVGAYGKQSAFCNSTNTGILDYINNNLQVLQNARVDMASNKADKNAIITDYANVSPADVTATSGNVTVCDSFIITPGTWLVTASSFFGANATGYRALGLSKSSTALYSERPCSMRIAAAPNVSTNITLTCILKATTDTRYYVNVLHNSGTDIIVNSAYRLIKLI